MSRSKFAAILPSAICLLFLVSLINPSFANKSPRNKQISDLNRNQIFKEDLFHDIEKNNAQGILLGLKQDTTSSTQANTGSNGGTLLGTDVPVQTPTDTADPLADVQQRTSDLAAAQTTDTNQLEKKLLNQEYDKAAEIQAEEDKVAAEKAAEEQAAADAAAADAAAAATAAAIAEEEAAQAAAREAAEKEEPEELEPTPAAAEEAPEDVAPIQQAPAQETTKDDNLFFDQPYISEDDKKGATNRNMITLLVAFAIGIFLMIIVSIRDVLNKIFNSIFLQRINSIARDVMVLIIIVTLVLYVHFLGVNYFDVHINAICLCLSIFGLSWLALGMILIISASSFSVTWEERETSLNGKDKILIDYTRIYSDIEDKKDVTSQETKYFNSLKPKISYFLMRQNFIAPSYLPIVNESFLRDDFNFAGYLTLALDKTLKAFFRLNSATIFTSLMLLYFWAGITRIEENHIEMIIMSLLLPMFTYFVYKIRSKLILINSRLVTPFDNPREISFLKYDTNRDPWCNLQNPLPNYLELAETIDMKTRFFGGQKKSNIHERLFWYQSPSFTMTLTHSLIVAEIIWAIIFYSSYSIVQVNVWGQILTWTLTVIFLLNLCYLLPTIIYTYTINSNIEMMKDRNLIYMTISTQRRHVRAALVKLYRLLKSARRESLSNEKSAVKLREFIIKVIKEAFKKLNPNGWEIEIRNLPIINHLCGSKLELDELIYLARDCSSLVIFSSKFNPKENNHISFDDFIATVDRLTQDVKLEPYQVSKEVLSTISKEEEIITLKELKDILDSFKILSRDVIDEIIHEFKYLSPNNSKLQLINVASMIRNLIEEHPR